MTGSEARHRHAMPFGAELVDGGVRFAIWAPTAPDLTLLVEGREHDMPQAAGGWRSTVVGGVGPGARYAYRVGDDVVPDPASRFQPEDVTGPSLVIDPTAFRWTDAGWRGRPWEEAVIYEAHVGTVTPEGTYAGLAKMLPSLVDLGVTAVELMPIGDFLGRRNWGYDGVLPYAPDGAYGTPDDLKRLIDRAHGLGLMMFLDVVYNHFGPVGNHLSKYAASFFTDRHKTPWGDGLNVDGPEAGPVREFFIQNALYWITEYRFDGLRFDAVHAIQDDSREHLIAELARRIREVAGGRHVHLILENEHNEARWLERDPAGSPRLHTAQWDDDIHHCWHTLLTGESEAYYEDFADDPVGRLARCLAEGFAYQGDCSRHAGGRRRGEPSGHLPPTAFVSFLQNHDQIGNRAFGDRLTGPPSQMRIARAGLLLAPQIPMLFMGEEWGASTPFQFFVDFSSEPALAQAVRDGRRREFRKFTAFADPQAAQRIPDPTAEATFAHSVLDPSERERSPHREILAETRELLDIRRRVIVPLTRTPYAEARAVQPTPEAVDVVWRYAGGTLRFAANFGDRDLAVDVAASERVLWSAPGLRQNEGKLILPPWTAFATIKDAR